jgi:hypothetical protein
MVDAPHMRRDSRPTFRVGDAYEGAGIFFNFQATLNAKVEIPTQHEHLRFEVMSGS